MFLAPTFLDPQTSIGEVFERVYRFSLQASSKNRQAINLIPWVWMEEPYRRESAPWSHRHRTVTEYVHDAHAISADFLVLNKASRVGETIVVELSMLDLRTSRTEDWKTSRPTAEVRELLRDTIVKTATFCGLSGREISEAGLDRNLPGVPTWEIFLGPNTLPQEAYTRALQTDPDSIVLHESLIQRSGVKAVEYANQALQKWPDEPRLLLQKVKKLQRQGKGAAALLLHSELLRRYPRNFLVLQPLSATLDTCYPQDRQASSPPPAFLAAQAALWNATVEYPGNWGLHWAHGYVSNLLAGYVRGTRTASHIPREIWSLHTLYSGQSGRSIDRALRLRPDSSELLRAAVEIHCLKGQKDEAWYQEALAGIRKIDPSNVAAEVALAYSKTAGWSDPDEFLPFLREAIEHHRNDRRAMYKIADSLGEHIGRLVGFKVKTEQEAFGPNPSSDLLIQLGEDLVSDGYGLNDDAFEALYHVYKVRGQQHKADALDAALKRVFDEPMNLMNAKKYEESLAMARQRLEKAWGSNVRHWLRYVIVKSLWKMGKHEESLQESLAGIDEFPKRHTFHYMYAIVALEKDLYLEDALHHAEIAMPLDPQNAGLQETLQKLRAKLGK